MLERDAGSNERLLSMYDFVVTFIVFLFVVLAIVLVSGSYSRDERKWIWLAFAEHLVGGIGQWLHSHIEGGDQNAYREFGGLLARTLDLDFAWASHEMFELLLQRPSAFDELVLGAGTNTGSMCAASGYLFFLVRGSEYAASMLVVGIGTLSAIGFYSAFRDAAPRTSPFRTFVATVLFPSVAFWSTGLLKEMFCILGLSLLLLAWRAAYNRKVVRFLLCAPAGIVLTLMFRAPSLPPLFLGIAAYFVVDRIRSSGKARAFAPFYIAFGLLVLVAGILLVGKVVPGLAIDKLTDSVANQQQSWTRNGGIGGGSGFDLEEPLALTPGQQALRAPVALVNALLRPQLFDVRNGLMLISALEMTLIAILIIQAIRRYGFTGVVRMIQRSPFLLMCTVITIVGCTFVGLTTLNFGSLSRYRAPFLPFYGMLLAVLSDRTAVAKVPIALRSPPRRIARRVLAPPRTPSSFVR